MNDGYSICLNKWALDKEIKNDLGLLLIISSLCAEKGYCFASNKYLADIFDITEVSISSKISRLEKKGYITVEYQKRGCEIISRKIRLKNILIDDLKIFEPTIKENFKENNISNNNISINKKEIYKERFKPPTLEEIKDYCLNVRHNDVNYQKFYDYYTTGKWKDKDGKPIKNWKQKIITWEGRNKKEIEVPKWFGQNNNAETMTQEDKDELENILKEIGE